MNPCYYFTLMKTVIMIKMRWVGHGAGKRGAQGSGGET